jgi:hypothetical protein
MSNDRRGRKQGRENDNGRFVDLDWARKHPKESTVEVVPTPGNGDTGRYDKPKKEKDD